MDSRPVTLDGCVGGDTSVSEEPSMKNTDHEVMFRVSMQSGPYVHHLFAGNSIGITVLISPPDLIRAFADPPAP